VAHYNLGNALKAQSRLPEAIAAFKKVLEIAPPGNQVRRTAEEEIRLCGRLIELDCKLPAVLRGDIEPADAAEHIALADLCQQPFKRLYAGAARLYADAFAADPKLAADLQRRYRYNAACSAALAAAGQGEDARSLPDKVAFRLRRQALDWLKADLAEYAKMAERGEPAAKQMVRQRMAHWRQDADFVSVRDKDALDRLSEAERQAWQQLWADVDALLKKASPAGPPP
jgi:serine/threonine-protein kinase